jgi:hypothetical protein
MPQLKPMEGKTFGRLTVVECLGTNKYRDRIFLCKCSCGGESKVAGCQLRLGRTRSCGCLKVEASKRGNLKHGLSREGGSQARLYRIWSHMRQRCSNPNDKIFKYYGGRGIKVCREWDESCVAFHGWALAHGYNPGLSIERVDNNGNYDPENCIWASRQTQALNKRTSRLITHNGITLNLSEWSKILRVSVPLLIWRIRKWGERKALSGNEMKRQWRPTKTLMVGE